MWYIGVLLCFVAGSRQLTITEFAVPTSIQAGEDAHFRCKYGLERTESDRALFVKWWWTPHGSEDRSQLYQRIAGHPADVLHTNIHVEEGDNIKITDVSPRDAGTYECEVSNIDEIRVHAPMAVFTSGDGPHLNITDISRDDDGVSVREVQLSCAANDVAPEPDLTITVNGEIVDITKTIEWTVYENMFNVSVNATAPLEEVEGAEISCELVYTDVNITHPQYKHTLTYYSDSAALSTTVPPERTTTTDGTTIENENGGAVELASYFVLVFSAFSILLVVNN